MKFDPTNFKIIAYFHLKSGTALEVYCDNLNITFRGDELESYNMEGCARGHALYIRLDDISAITYQINPKWEEKK